MLIEKWSHLMLTIRGEVSQPVWYLRQILCVSKLVQNRMLCKYIITPPANSDSTNCLNKFANLVFKRQRPAVVRTQSPKIALCHNNDRPHWVEPAMYCELDQTWDSAECGFIISICVFIAVYLCIFVFVIFVFVYLCICLFVFVYLYLNCKN